MQMKCNVNKCEKMHYSGSDPLSTAGVSEKTVSVATASCLLGMLSAGFLDFKCFFIGNVLGMETPHWVDCSMFSEQYPH